MSSLASSRRVWSGSFHPLLPRCTGASVCMNDCRSLERFKMRCKPLYRASIEWPVKVQTLVRQRER